jgi:hypothetical protein
MAYAPLEYGYKVSKVVFSCLRKYSLDGKILSQIPQADFS